MLRNLGIRSKLLALIAVPMTLLLAVSLVLVVQARSQAAHAERVTGLTTASQHVHGAVHALQDERALTGRYLETRRPADRAAMEAARQPVDSQLRGLREVVAIDLSVFADDVAERIRAATGQHDTLPQVRASIDEPGTTTADVLRYYDRVIATDLALSGVVADVAGAAELARGIRAYGALSSAIEAAALERDLLAAAFARRFLSPEDFRRFAGLVAQQDAQLRAFDSLADAAQRTRLDRAPVERDGDALASQRSAATELLVGRGNGDAAAVVQAAERRIDSLVGVERSLVADVSDVASALAAEERRSAYVFGGIALAGLATTLLLVLVLSRRLVSPLRRLTATAEELGEALPGMVERMQTPGEGPGVDLEPVPVESADEIGKLASAFNAVNETTVKVAHQQAALRASIAEMFVNVARRNQVLLGRQLAFIDAMEQREEDPDALESLFRLDHLATRMRRNAESLLVLAGIEANRRLRRPMPVTDVIRTAASEIEQYQRIDVVPQVDPPVGGRFALTMAHLLAELLENATHFSDPQTRVVVACTRGEDGVVVTITDSGLGMTEEEIAEANERIAAPPVAEIAVAQRLGLLVVGRLAQRLGARVTLRRGEVAGVIVDAIFPASVLERAGDRLPELTRTPAVDAAPEPAGPAEPAAPEPAAERAERPDAAGEASDPVGVVPAAAGGRSGGLLSRLRRRTGVRTDSGRTAGEAEEPDQTSRLGTVEEPADPSATLEPVPAEPPAATPPFAGVYAPSVDILPRRTGGRRRRGSGDADGAPCLGAVRSGPVAPARPAVPPGSLAEPVPVVDPMGPAGAATSPQPAAVPHTFPPAMPAASSPAAPPASSPPASRPAALPAAPSAPGRTGSKPPPAVPGGVPPTTVTARATPVTHAPLPTRPPAVRPGDVARPAPEAVVPIAEVDRTAAGSQIASAALAELSRLSSGYEPSFQAGQEAADGGLTRRQRRPAPAPEPPPAGGPPATSTTPQRDRNPAEVRGMLSGYRAGVERGRAGADDPAPGTFATSPPQEGTP